ncbi:MAG: type III-A CRISPR-associated protein Csm2 [Candidatus Woesearchaeota archaeon]
MNVMDLLELRDPKGFIEDAEKFTREINEENGKDKRIISNTQLRKIYDQILHIKYENLSELYLLKPKLVYMRERKNITDNFVKKINAFIDNISTEKHLINFKKYMEAVVAYNKQYGKE